jgi:arsenate reductase
MNHAIIYHNPRCSKSREALALLKHHVNNPVIIEYLKHPLTLEELMALRAYIELKEFVRYDDALFKELHLTLDDEATILKTMVKEPSLMQRPIIVYNDKVIVARPPEKVDSLFR